jgi:hypothetical protein
MPKISWKNREIALRHGIFCKINILDSNNPKITIKIPWLGA